MEFLSLCEFERRHRGRAPAASNVTIDDRDSKTPPTSTDTSTKASLTAKSAGSRLAAASVAGAQRIDRRFRIHIPIPPKQAMREPN
jgi:hypothetical protein